MCFKRKKLKNIELKQDISQYLVFPYSLKGGVVWLNHSAIVPENAILIFAGREKLLDVLQTGEHMLGAVTLPKASKKFKLYKLNKDGSVPEYFDGFAYFVNLKTVSGLTFQTYRKLKYRNEIDGKFTVKINFSVDIQVENYEDLFKGLFSEFSYLKLHETENIVRNWLSEFTTDTLQKEMYRRSDFENNISETVELLTVQVKNFAKKFGLNIENFNIIGVDVSKSKKKQLEDKRVMDKKDIIKQEQKEKTQESTWKGWEENLK